MKIDVHNHTFPDTVIGLLEKEDVYGLKVKKGVMESQRYGTRELFPSLIDPAAKIEELQRGGLDGAVICPDVDLFAYDVNASAAEKLAVAVNRGMAEFCRAFPDRLRWMASVPMQSPELAVSVMEEAVRVGAVGVEIGTAIAERRPDNAEFEPFWAAAERLRLPVFAHPAYNRPHDGLNGYHLQNVIGNPLETTIFVERLICSGMLDRHPGVRLVLAHAGGYYPYQAGRLRHARTVRPELRSAPEDPWAYSRQLSIDTITHDRQALQYLVSRVGAASVIVGTDYPFDMATARPMEDLLAAVDASTARQIAEENPARLFSFV